MNIYKVYLKKKPFQLKAIEEYFPVVLFIMLYKDDLCSENFWNCTVHSTCNWIIKILLEELPFRQSVILQMMGVLCISSDKGFGLNIDLLFSVLISFQSGKITFKCKCTFSSLSSENHTCRYMYMYIYICTSTFSKLQNPQGDMSQV